MLHEQRRVERIRVVVVELFALGEGNVVVPLIIVVVVQHAHIAAEFVGPAPVVECWRKKRHTGGGTMSDVITIGIAGGTGSGKTTIHAAHPRRIRRRCERAVPRQLL